MKDIIKTEKLILISFVFVLVFGIVYAAEDEFAEAKNLIDAKTPCKALSDLQMEAIGDYYMELMHPGQAHQSMENMMGGEGSANLRQMHIAMAKRLYCNNQSAISDYELIYGYGQGGMMNMAGRKSNYGMMGYGMAGSGMMGYGYGYWSLLGVLWLLLSIGLVALVYLWIIKLWKETFRKK